MDLSFLENKDILVLGAGLTGLSCARFLASQNIKFSLNDSRANAIDADSFSEQFPNAYLSTGHWDKALINHADVIIASPGIDLATPDIEEAIHNDCDVLGDVELFARITNRKTFAVTGSNGKSTVVSLLAFLGEALGHKTQLGGNVGVPVLDTLDESPDFLVLELSSFQLETLTSMKAIAATVLNVSDDHLDRHKTIENYQAIKQKIYQQAETAIVNRDDLRTVAANDAQISFGQSESKAGEFGLKVINGQSTLCFGDKAIIAANDLPLSGQHNAMNCLAAFALGHCAGWSLDEMAVAIKDFKGLPHRCQLVESHDGIIWVNDSKATNVGATIAAIEGFAEHPNDIYLIAGGDGKGADLDELAPVINTHIKHLITLGKDGDKIASLSAHSTQVADINAAVDAAKKHAKQGDLVLLSPACASIDMFKNYMERGDLFAKAVQGGQS